MYKLHLPFCSTRGVSFFIPKYSFTAIDILDSKVLNVLGAKTWVRILSAPSSISWDSCLKINKIVFINVFVSQNQGNISELVSH